jgi:transcriptional regulator with XRE-family HTH domain
MPNLDRPKLLSKLRKMQAPRGPPPASPQIGHYNRAVSRKPSPSRGPRPAQGARLLAFRKAAGLTQIELAQALSVSNANIAFWEWSEKPPRSDLLPRMAQILHVRVEDILGITPNKAAPVGRLQRTFEKVRALSRRQQDLVVRFVDTLAEQQKAS